MRKRRFFFDLDRTLYDTDAVTQSIHQDLCEAGHHAEDVKRHAASLHESGYSFERHMQLLGIPTEEIACKADTLRAHFLNGNRYLYPDVLLGIEYLKHLGECILLTFGDPAFQGEKVNGINLIQSNFTVTHFVWLDRKKSDVIRRYGQHAETWFFENDPKHLEDVRIHTPWVKCVRIARERLPFVPHPLDGKQWPVVETLDGFIRLVEEA